MRVASEPEFTANKSCNDAAVEQLRQLRTNRLALRKVTVAQLRPGLSIEDQRRYGELEQFLRLQLRGNLRKLAEHTPRYN